MASSMELEKDRSFDALVDIGHPARSSRSSTSVVRHLRPPPYPYAIDRDAGGARAARCSTRSEIGCAQCHGVYDGSGNVDWPGVHTDVGTDRARLDVVSDAFIDAFDDSPIAAEGALVKSQRLCGDAADRRLGELSLSAQRQRADASSPARTGGRAAGDLRRDGGATLRSRTRRAAAVRRAGARAGSSETELLRRFGGDRDWFNTRRGVGQRRPRLLVAHQDRRQPPRAHRVSEDAVSAPSRYDLDVTSRTTRS